ncbi:hypothetical protein [Sphingobacterium bovistauri]|uniref:Long-chain fatty acid transport protein n=1 Tax=Sphingobacterium bovistauri TaxID=2781959 RepID=A0ABS7Z1C8_9SPHI|nr:hypothetical protein [Sphingobacterium bovistauri]MCA5003931.1 hypothetical protein [Sphingobacterium bovistauri]
MYRKSNILIAQKAIKIMLGTAFMLTSSGAFAQETTSHSPYSKFGLGQMREDLLPQTRSMGGISSAVRYQSGLPILNIANPASYSGLNRTVLDAGLYGNMTQLSKGTAQNNTADFAFSHFGFGFSVARNHGVAFGLMPYSDVGYNNTETRTMSTITTLQSKTGEGGLNKAFVGYGFSPFKGFSIGGNAGLLFGELKDNLTVSFPNDFNALNARSQATRLVRGLIVDYGAQYSFPVSKKHNITLGYSGSLNNTVTEKTSHLTTRSQPSLDPDFENVALDSLPQTGELTRNINLPMKHSVGITVSKGYDWMIGADFKYADWTSYQTRAGESSLGKNYGIALGGQWKPDASSNKYWDIVDYRLGVRYNQGHITVNNNRIDDMAITLGFGLPLPETNFGRTSSRINISAEFGQQGTLNNNLVRERYININIGFNINDLWFQRRSYD